MSTGAVIIPAMSLPSGSRLGPFEITSLLGAGGMGEVYRARDTRLGREVAVKVLAPELAADADAMARFEREARAVATLNHPNILALYDIGHDAGTTFVVTEFLEGATLRERLTQGPVPLRKAIDWARQVAGALAAAHERGVVHRDVKPENLFLTADGRVKVLDFGLAQTAPLTAIDTTVAATGVGTAPGAILGTLGYMAPEQVRAQTVDHRADIFACGAVLYELITGHRAFDGTTAADTISAVLNNDPPSMTRAVAAVPPHLERVVQRCLEKSPAERFQSARDLAFALTEDDRGDRHAPRSWLAAHWPKVAGGLAVAAILAVAANQLWQSRAPQTSGGRPPAAKFAIAAGSTWSDAASISPDGNYVVYTGAPSTAPSFSTIGVPGARPSGFAPISGRFWLRRLDALTATPLSDTDSAYPLFFWSPDSRSLGYRAGDAIVVRELPSGTPRVVTELASAPTGAAWGQHGDILISAGDGIYVVPASGGGAKLLMATQPGREVWRGTPAFLPGGEQFLFSVLTSGKGEEALETRVASRDGKEVATVGRGLVGAAYADGYLLFGSGGALFAQPFDLKTLTLTGTRVQLADGVTQDWRTGRVAASASDNGVLVFRAAPQSEMRFVVVNRAGGAVRQVGAPDNFTNFSVSPDEQRVIATRRDPISQQRSLWLIDMVRGVTSLASDRGDTEDSDDPTWAADGQSVAFQHGARLVIRLANGGPERTLVNAEAYPDDFSRDGRFIVYGRPHGNLFEQWALDLTTPGATPIAIAPGVTLADEGRVSPNGRWVAYHSNESGTAQVYVVALPPTGEKWQVSQAGGVQPRWSADGKELFFLDTEGRLMSVTMRDSDPRTAAAPVALFSTGVMASDSLDQFAPVREGFLLRVQTSAADAAAVQVLINWKPARQGG